MTAPPKFVRSVTSPYFSDDTVSMNVSPILAHTDFGTNARDAAEHFCP